MITLYNVLSADGYIARSNGSEDFIPDEWWLETLKVYAKHDALVMGRKTYEVMQSYPSDLMEPFEALPIKKIIVTRDTQFRSKSGYIVVHSPEEALKKGERVLVSSGPTLNTYIVEHDLVNEILFHYVPTAIGEGIKPFTGSELGRFTVVSKTTLELGVEEVVHHKISK